MSITLQDFFKAILKRWYIIVAITVVFVLMGFIASKFLINKKYESFSRAYIFVTVEGETKGMTEVIATSHSNALAGSLELYKELSEELKKNNLGDFDALELKSAIKVAVVAKDLNIINTTCEWTDPYKAQQILKLFNNIYISNLAELPFVDQSINMIIQDQPDLKLTPSSPNILINVLLFFLIGAIISVIIVYIVEFSNSKIRTADDITLKLNKTVIGEIPAYSNKKTGSYKDE